MCGIFASISSKSFTGPSNCLECLLRNRGPDHFGVQNALIETSKGSKYWVSLTSTVLALRGGQVQPQPFQDFQQTGSILCWNGEAWKTSNEHITGNDGQAIFDLLLKASSAQPSALESTDAVLEVLRSISGPFSFLFLDKIHNQIFFGRDRLGRRSLLYNISDQISSMEIASVSDPSRGVWKEIEADGIYVMSFCENQSPPNISSISEDSLLSSSIQPLHRYNWNTNPSFSSEFSLGEFNRTLPVDPSSLNSESASVQLLHQYLSESLKLRILQIPSPPSMDTLCTVRVAVLFSGGIDCTVLARLTHDIIPSDQHIDLINVAFENPRVVQAAKVLSKQTSNEKNSWSHIALKTEDSGSEPSQALPMTGVSHFEACPDRQTGRKALQELRRICPNRVWRFIEVNVPYSETIQHKSKVVDLIHPHNTEMDLSIAYALYFASRGTGLASIDPTASPVVYTTPARVLLSGLGADELFGGYQRHEIAFRRRGFFGLFEELELDISRLGRRNLGRDDRIIANWGREVRLPFLDESLVKWAVECPIWQKCGFKSSQEEKDSAELEPGKKVLRLLGYKLGLHSTSYEPKRAIQFGARTARMEVGGTKKGTTLIS